MNTEKQTEALRLAAWAEWFLRNVKDPEDFRWIYIADMAKELRRQHELLVFVERWACHHGAKPHITAEQAISAIQHHPGIAEITDSYVDGKRPSTFDPYAQIAELEALRLELSQLKTQQRKAMEHNSRGGRG